MSDLTAIQDLLQTTYLPGIQELLNNKGLCRSLLEVNQEDFKGDHVERPLHIGRNHGHGSRKEGETLPIAGKQKYSKAMYYMKYHYGAISVTGPAIGKSSTDGSYISVVDSEVKGLITDKLKDMNRMAYGESVGTVCNITDSIASNATHTVDTTKWLNVVDGGLPKFDIVSINTTNNQFAVVATDLTIASISGNSVTFSGAFASNGANLEYVVVYYDSATSENYGLTDIISEVDPRGIANYTGDGNQTALGGIARASNTYWQAGANRNGGTLRDFNINMLEQAEEWAEIEGDGKIDYHLTTFAIWRKYANLLLPDRRYTSMGEAFPKLDSGYEYLEHDGIPVVRDKDCPTNTIFSINSETIEFYPLTDWDWMQLDGAILARTPGVDGYGATLYKYENMGCWDPRDNYITTDIRE